MLNSEVTDRKTVGVAQPMRSPRLRLDRSISLGLVYPLQRLFRSRETGSIPILMYHSISPAGSQKHPYFEINTSPETLAAHMQYLADNGYRSLGLSAAINALTANESVGKAVVITVDDGFLDFYTQAAPILDDSGFTATVFVVSEFSAGAASQAGREYMTWQQIRELNNHGFEIGSHTVRHPELYRMDSRAIRAELADSKSEIENRIGSSVESFAYPYAFPEQDRRFVQELKSLLESEGYRYGVSTIIGTAEPKHDKFFLPRLPVNSHDDVELFEAKLNRGYDWLHAPQYLHKCLKQVIQ